MGIVLVYRAGTLTIDDESRARAYLDMTDAQLDAKAIRMIEDLEGSELWRNPIRTKGTDF